MQKKFRNKIQGLEDRMGRMVKADLKTYHHFGHQIYGRELHIPAGTALTGKIHRYSCINVVTEGTIAVATEEGEHIVEAPAVFVSPPGIKRAGYAITDTVWITFHHSEQTDPELVEEEVIAKDYVELDKPGPKLPPSGLTTTEETVLKSLLIKHLNGKNDKTLHLLLRSLNET